MAGRDDDTCDAAKLPQRKGKLRRGAQRLKAIGTDPVGVQTERCLLGKFHGHVPGIEGNGHALLFSTLLPDIVRQPLGRFCHRIDVHPVCPGSDHAPESSGPKGQVLVKPVLDFLFLPGDLPKLRPGRLVKNRIRAPLPVFVSVIHLFSSISKSGFQHLFGLSDHCLSELPASASFPLYPLPKSLSIIRRLPCPFSYDLRIQKRRQPEHRLKGRRFLQAVHPPFLPLCQYAKEDWSISPNIRFILCPSSTILSTVK